MQSAKTEDALPLPQPMAPTAPDPLLRKRLMVLAAVEVVICLLFAAPLIKWASIGISKDRSSYLLLVPCITAYLIWTRRPRPQGQAKSSVAFALVSAAIGVGALFFSGHCPDPGDQLSLRILSLLAFLSTSAFFLIGLPLMRQVAFPLVFLLFAIPMPPTFENYIEIFLQHGSADAADLLLSVSGVPMVRNGLEFTFPNLAIRVAQECSGYNSTFSLFLVSTLASYLFLQRGWTRTVLCLAVLPLALLRNGFRITVLSLLSVYDDPKWIDSPLHHRGGPIWFALSLIPFLALLFWLRKMDSKAINQKNSSDD